MAFVEVAETSPSATPWICRLPMATTPLVGAWFTVNVEPETTPLAVVQVVVAVTAEATESLPRATELASETLLPLPMDTALFALALAPAPDVVPLAPPIAMELVPAAELLRPMATARAPVALDPPPPVPSPPPIATDEVP